MGSPDITLQCVSVFSDLLIVSSSSCELFLPCCCFYPLYLEQFHRLLILCHFMEGVYKMFKGNLMEQLNVGVTENLDFLVAKFFYLPGNIQYYSIMGPEVLIRKNSHWASDF